MDGWTVVRFVHVVALIFFVGGQLMLVAAVVPAIRRHGTDAAMRMAAKRFGIGSGIALALLIASGVAMAGRFDLWPSSVLQAKLAVFVLVLVLLGLHVASPRSRPLSLVLLGASLFVVWLGLRLAHG
jgi:uncharacterized membrane protein